MPGWVVPPLRAVARVEDFTLRLYDRTRSPEVLGAWTSLAWLGTTDLAVGEQILGPYGRGLPTHVAAFQALRIADALAEGYRHPPESWWAARGFDPAARIGAQEWEQLVYDLHERAHAHGVRVALGWLLGELPYEAVGSMAPIHHQDGRRVDAHDRELYAQRLRELADLDSAAPAVHTPDTAG